MSKTTVKEIGGDSPLVAFAREELERAGLFDKDSDYEGMLGEAVLELVKKFAKQGHSGTSASITLDIATQLMRYEPITPLTFDDDEWIDQSEPSGFKIWQNRRKSTIFSHDFGDTWYDIDEEGRPLHHGRHKAGLKQPVAQTKGQRVDHPIAK